LARSTFRSTKNADDQYTFSIAISKGSFKQDATIIQASNMQLIVQSEGAEVKV